MSAITQLVTVEKMIVGSQATIAEIKLRAAEHSEDGGEGSTLDALLIDAEAMLDYLNELLDALQFVVGFERKHA